MANRRSWLEIKVLMHLNDLELDKGRPAELTDLRENLVPDEPTAVASIIRHLHNEGLVQIVSPKEVIGLRLVHITPQGKSLLLKTLNAGREDCD